MRSPAAGAGEAARAIEPHRGPAADRLRRLKAVLSVLAAGLLIAVGGAVAPRQAGLLGIALLGGWLVIASARTLRRRMGAPFR